MHSVLASGKTPAGTHQPVMVAEVLECPASAARPDRDGLPARWGQSRARNSGAVAPGGKFIGLDVDPIELPRTEATLWAARFGLEMSVARRTHFAGLAQRSDSGGAIQ